MERKEILEELENIDLGSGFEFLSKRNGYFGYRNENGERYFSLDGKFSDKPGNIIGGLNLNICFVSLQKYLDPSFESVGDGEAPSHMRPFTHQKIFRGGIIEEYSKNFPFEITNKGDLDAIKSSILYFYFNFGESFFAYWSSIKSYLPFLEVDFEDYRAMNDILGVDAILKKMIIWWLCDHPKAGEFIEFREQKLNALKKSDPKNAKVNKALAHFTQVKENLIKASPLYPWDGDYLQVKPFKGVMPKV